MPASTVHDVALAPQTHEAEEECGAEPSWWSHARPVTAHRHPMSVPPMETPQLIEESFLGLTTQLGPKEEQPGGYFSKDSGSIATFV